MNLQISQTKLVKVWQIIFAEGQPYTLKALRYYTAGCYPRDPKPLLLFDFIGKYAPDFQHEKLNSTAAYLVTFAAKRLAPKEYEAAETKLKLTLSELFQRTEEYIVQANALLNMQHYPSIPLLELYTQPQLKTCFDDYWRKAQTLVQPAATAAAAKYAQGQSGNFRQLNERYLALQIHQDYCLQMGYMERLDFETLGTALRDFTSCYVLRFQLEADAFSSNYRLDDRAVGMTKYDIPVEIQANDPPLLALLRAFTRSVNSPVLHEKEESATAAVALLQQNYTLFSQTELIELFSMAANCIGSLIQANRFNTDYYKKLHDLYKLKDEIGLFLQPHGSISLMQYKNSVTVALMVGDADFAKHFTEKYKDKLVNIVQKHRTNADEMYQYNKAQLAFYEKRYLDVEKLLRFNETQHTILGLDAEILILKAYFNQELMEFKGKYIETNVRKSSFLLRLQQFEQRLLREKTANTMMYKNFTQLLAIIANGYKTHRIGLKIEMPETWLEDLFVNHAPTLEERWLRSKAQEVMTPTLG
ncbi:MAG: hypothetical protein RI894_1614 [Bacteroidota bacterium]|jgi:hypothetical protein